MSKCNYCKKRASKGNLVSHAKNRTKRWFRPNIQKLRVLSGGRSIRVALCTKCIKRLKKDGKLGHFCIIKYSSVAKTVAPSRAREKKAAAEAGKKEERPEKILKTPEKQEKLRPVMSIEDIVGRKS